MTGCAWIAAGMETTKADIDTCRDIFRAIRGEREIIVPMEVSEGVLGLENRANEAILSMICSVAVFHGHEVATKEDAERALKIYRDIGEHSINKLTKAEKDLLKALLLDKFYRGNKYMATAEELADVLGKSRSAITLTWRGRNTNEEHKSYGLSSKVPGLDTETITATKTVGDSVIRNTEQRKVFYYVFNGSPLDTAAVKQKYMS
jgi:hypothetical protein